MADWTASSGSKIRPYRNYTAPTIRHFEESTAASSAVIALGDVLTFDTVVATASHRVLRAPSSAGTGTNLMQVDITSLLGVALQASTSDGGVTGLTSNGLSITSQNRQIAICLATGNQEFVGYASTMAPASSAANLALIGREAPLVFDRTNKVFTVATANATAALAAVQITEIPQHVLGDSGAYPVVFKFLSTNLSPVVPGFASQ